MRQNHKGLGEEVQMRELTEEDLAGVLAGAGPSSSGNAGAAGSLAGLTGLTGMSGIPAIPSSVPSSSPSKSSSSNATLGLSDLLASLGL